jgi:chloramphenicol O-acetyltransferase type A
MATYLDLDRWPRRASFDYFRAFDKPYFNVCARLDVSRLKPALAEAGGGLSLACYFIALRLVNDMEPFRLRLENGRVRVHEVIHGATALLRDDESLGFAYFDHDADYRRFVAQATAAIHAARSGQAPFDPKVDEAAVIHLTSLPWVHFTSFSHARNWRREDSVPKLAFGRVDGDGDGRQWLPLSVEVHHGLMDGVHVGRFFERFEAVLQAPGPWLGGAP